MKNFLIKLKKKFASNIFIKLRDTLTKPNRLLFVVLYLILLIFFLDKYPYLVLINIILLTVVFKKNRILFYLLMIISLIISSRIIIRKINFNNQDLINLNTKGKVYKVVHYDDYNRIYFYSYLDKNNYYFNTSDYPDLQAGSIIYLEGNINYPKKEALPEGFSNENYSFHNNLKGSLEITKLIKIKDSFSLNLIHEKLYLYIKNNHPVNYSGIISALTIGEKQGLGKELNEQIQIIGIGHLFVISGLHIELIVGLLLFLFRKLKYKHYYTFLILIFYYIIAGMLVSILRVIISFLFVHILKDKMNLNNRDKLLLSILIVLLINPFYLFSYSFLLSYSIVLGIIYLQRYLKKDKSIKSYFYNSLLISLSSLLISFPIIYQMGSSINLLSIIFNLFFIPFVSFIILPFSFLVVIIPHLGLIYGYILEFFLFLTKYLSQIKIFTINIGKISSFPSNSFNNLISIIISSLIFIFYLLILKKEKKKLKLVLIYFSFIIISFLLPKLNINNRITFLSLPIGDAVMIEESFNKTKILIDTGGSDNDELLNYLINHGIRKLDGIIISHGDDDHIGGLEKIIKEIKVKNIYASYFDSSSKQIINKLNISNVSYLRKNDEIRINNILFKVLSPDKDYHDPNNNSLVLYAEIFGLKYLFTGDIEKEIEERLICPYSVDVLKVAHHGSNTSSTLSFLKRIKPNIAISMNGHHNMFGFPREEVVKRYEELGIDLYNTIDKGSIQIVQNIFNNKNKISYTYKG